MRALFKTIGGILTDHTEVVFAYVHGSVLHSENPSDVDVAIFIESETHQQLSEKGEITLECVIPLEMEIEKCVDLPVDLQPINTAPLAFKYRVISSGKVVVDTDPAARADFESLAYVEYFDFRPRQDEYMQEVFA